MAVRVWSGGGVATAASHGHAAVVVAVMLVCRANHDVEGEPAALYHVAFEDGPLAGDEEDLEEWELLQSLPLPGTTEFAPVPSSTEPVPVGATPFQAGNESCGRKDAAAALSYPSPMSPRSLTRRFKAANRALDTSTTTASPPDGSAASASSNYDAAVRRVHDDSCTASVMQCSLRC